MIHRTLASGQAQGILTRGEARSFPPHPAHHTQQGTLLLPVGEQEPRCRVTAWLSVDASAPCPAVPREGVAKHSMQTGLW